MGLVCVNIETHCHIKGVTSKLMKIISSRAEALPFSHDGEYNSWFEDYADRFLHPWKKLNDKYRDDVTVLSEIPAAVCDLVG